MQVLCIYHLEGYGECFMKFQCQLRQLRTRLAQYGAASHETCRNVDREQYKRVMALLVVEAQIQGEEDASVTCTPT